MIHASISHGSKWNLSLYLGEIGIGINTHYDALFVVDGWWHLVLVDS